MLRTYQKAHMSKLWLALVILQQWGGSIGFCWGRPQTATGCRTPSLGRHGTLAGTAQNPLGFLTLSFSEIFVISEQAMTREIRLGFLN